MAGSSRVVFAESRSSQQGGREVTLIFEGPFTAARCIHAQMHTRTFTHTSAHTNANLLAGRRRRRGVTRLLLRRAVAGRRRGGVAGLLRRGAVAGRRRSGVSGLLPGRRAVTGRRRSAVPGRRTRRRVADRRRVAACGGALPRGRLRARSFNWSTVRHSTGRLQYSHSDSETIMASSVPAAAARASGIVMSKARAEWLWNPS